MTSCDDIRTSLGALAVSALEPAEERQVLAHVADCPRCSAELAELSETVGLLAAAEPYASSAVLPVTPGPQLLDNLLTAVAEQRRRARRRRFALGLAAAAAAAVLGGTGALLITDEDPAPPPVAAPTPTAELRGSDGAVVLEVELFTKSWGTAVRGAVAGVPPGATCSLVAVGADGTREVAATWTVPRGGYDSETGKLWFDGGVGLQPHEVSRYEVVTPEGDVLVTAPAST
jgi:anti-sigma factor RsiW